MDGDEQAPLTRDSARAILKDSLAFLKKTRKKLKDAEVAEISTAQARLEAALLVEDSEEYVAWARDLTRLVERRLAATRPSTFREYTESIGVAVGLALLLRAFVMEAFQIPTASMEPTLLVGDHLFVRKFAYGIRIPFTTKYLVQWSEVSRGDIVVFEFPRQEVRTQYALGIFARQIEEIRRNTGSYPETLTDIAPGVTPSEKLANGALAHANDEWENPYRYTSHADGYLVASAGPDGTFDTADDLTTENSAFSATSTPCVDRDSLETRKDYIKRVIGLPGDRIAMRNNNIEVNGVPFDVEPAEMPPGGSQLYEYSAEKLDNGVRHLIAYRGSDTEFDEIIVRPGHVFAMGDNRDNSSDGRCWGQVPLENIKGTAFNIFWSSDRSGKIRWERFFQRVR